MSEMDEKIARLQTGLENLAKNHEVLQAEVNRIRYEINVLRSVQQKRSLQTDPEEPRKPPAREYVPPSRTREETAPKPTIRQTEGRQEKTPPTPDSARPANRRSAFDPTQTTGAYAKSDLEKFIGENLISKIGILILFIGVVIGAKYAVDRDLISPLMRILFGYAIGVGLLGFAIRLKEKYLNFSAVLLAGALAVMYFITFAAYGFYDLIPQALAFLLMVFFTAFTVLSAIKYERQIIAHFGLVGAYAVPFLLSNDSGRADILFGYMAIINAGILAVSVKKYWKPLFYSAFIFTWGIFYAWFLADYRAEQHFALALAFSSLFFLLFYATFLAYKLINKEPFSVENVFLLLANSFVFYGLGYALLAGREGWNQYLGVFTVANALVHFGVALFIYKYAAAEKEVVNLVIGLVLVFITIAAPVQMDGDWVTLIWTAEALILFWIGRTKAVPLYERFSYPLMMLAVLSLLQDWQKVYGTYFSSTDEIAVTPLLNAGLLTSVLFVVAFAYIHFLNRDERYEPGVENSLYRATLYLIPAVLLGVLYNAFRMEIGNYFQYREFAGSVNVGVYDGYQTRVTDNDWDLYNIVWQINYTLLFLSALAWLNVKRVKNEWFGLINIALNGFVMLLFLTVGLYCLGELRDSYLNPTQLEHFTSGAANLLIRYVSYACVASLLFSSYKLANQEFFGRAIPRSLLYFLFDFGLHFSALWILSVELLHWMRVFAIKDSDKLGLSILWGLYSVFLIVLGITGHKKHLRIGAITLFALTLVKLFLYDIAALDTISKTIVFVSLGALLLVISFLYNKYKFLIFEKTENQT